eukprot:scaffold18778_cov154-Amphora_coffeaeformis.AAC.5
MDRKTGSPYTVSAFQLCGCSVVSAFVPRTLQQVMRRKGLARRSTIGLGKTRLAGFDGIYMRRKDLPVVQQLALARHVLQGLTEFTCGTGFITWICKLKNVVLVDVGPNYKVAIARLKQPYPNLVVVVVVFVASPTRLWRQCRFMP